MNLLLLLSAMLSALTGAGGGARAVQPAAAVAQATQVQVARIAAAVTTDRPRMAAPALSDVRVITGAALTLISAEPLFAARRRE